MLSNKGQLAVPSGMGSRVGIVNAGLNPLRQETWIGNAQSSVKVELTDVRNKKQDTGACEMQELRIRLRAYRWQEKDHGNFVRNKCIDQGHGGSMGVQKKHIRAKPAGFSNQPSIADQVFHPCASQPSYFASGVAKRAHQVIARLGSSFRSANKDDSHRDGSFCTTMSGNNVNDLRNLVVEKTTVKAGRCLSPPHHSKDAHTVLEQGEALQNVPITWKSDAGVLESRE